MSSRFGVPEHRTQTCDFRQSTNGSRSAVVGFPKVNVGVPSARRYGGVIDSGIDDD